MKLKSLPHFKRVQWNPDTGELRSFAIAMLVGFALLAGLSVWRHHGVTASALVFLAVSLGLALSAAIPGLNRVAYLAVYLPTSFIGHYVSKVVLFFVFILVFVPIGLLLRLLGKDILRLRSAKPRAVWSTVSSAKESRRYYRQF